MYLVISPTLSLIDKFDRVYLVANENPELKSMNKNITLLLLPEASVKELSEALFAELKKSFAAEKIFELDIAISIISGSGKLHSAMLSAVLKIGYGIRIVDIENNELVEL